MSPGWQNECKQEESRVKDCLVRSDTIRTNCLEKIVLDRFRVGSSVEIILLGLYN